MEFTKSQIAEAFGVTLAAVDDWVKRQGCPIASRPTVRGGKWQFDLRAVIQWRISQQLSMAKPGGEDSMSDPLNEARRRKTDAEARVAEVEAAKCEGDAISILEAQAAWAAMVGSARAKLRGVGSKLGPLVAADTDPWQCRVMIDEAIDEALQELSEREIPINLDSEAEPEGSDGDVPVDMGTSAAANGKRVGRR